MATKAAHKRLSKEYIAMQKEPPPFIWAAPDEKNILTWNFLIRGPPDSVYAGGEYHGILLFPSEYPFKPPGIKMLTPSGRFQPDKKICFSMSDFHPGTWNPAWSVATILTGLLSFMLSDEMTTGSVTSSDEHKRACALRSHAWNLSQKRFRDAFPEYCTVMLRDLPNMGEKERGIPDNAPVPSTDGNSASASTSTPASTPEGLGAGSSDSGSNVVRRTSSASATQPVAGSGTGVQRVASSQGSQQRELTTTGDNAGPAGAGAGAGGKGWTGAGGRLSQLFCERWRWGLFIAFALVVSRLSSA